MKKTKLEWVDSTFNPISGCLYNCYYCYAKLIAEKYMNNKDSISKEHLDMINNNLPILLEDPIYNEDGKKSAYPFGFTPTFHKYRLKEVKSWDKPRSIFVGSMSDIFGDWIPDEWIEDILWTCACNHKHQYVFLTKNPKRYSKINNINLEDEEGIYYNYRKAGIIKYGMKNTNIIDLSNFWMGATVTNNIQLNEAYDSKARWLSIEPLFEELNVDELLLEDGTNRWDWIVIGAETGERENKITPKKEWINEIVKICLIFKIPVFMKNNLIPVIDERDLIKRYPWG